MYIINTQIDELNLSPIISVDNQYDDLLAYMHYPQVVVEVHAPHPDSPIMHINKDQGIFDVWASHAERQRLMDKWGEHTGETSYRKNL